MTRRLGSLREHLPLVALLLAFTAGLTLFQWSLHRRFAAPEWDLAIYDQALWQIVHGLWPDTPVLGVPKFTDHFDPILYLLAPPYALHPSPAWLLFYQAFFTALAGGGIYALALALLRSRPGPGDPRWPALGLACAFLFNPSTLCVGVSLYHSEIVAMALLAWTFWVVHRDVGPAPILVAAGLAALCKEDALVPFGAFGLYLALFDRPRRRLGLLLLGTSLALTALVLGVAVPALGGGQHHLADRYGSWGATPAAIVAGLADPARLVSHFSTWAQADRVLLRQLLGPTAGLFLLRPATALIWLPVLLEHLLSSHPPQHSIRYQYLTMALPGLYYGVTLGFAGLRRGRRAGLALLLAATFVGAVAAGPTADGRLQSTYPFEAELGRVLELLPPEAAVAAPPRAVSHLSRRPVLRTLPGREPFLWAAQKPRLADVEWILQDTAEGLLPAPGHALGILQRDLLLDPEFGVVAQDGPLVLLRRGAPHEEGLRRLPPAWRERLEAGD